MAGGLGKGGLRRAGFSEWRHQHRQERGLKPSMGREVYDRANALKKRISWTPESPINSTLDEVCQGVDG